MSTNKPTCPFHNDNRKRSEAKARRGFGKFAMEKAGMDQISWTRTHDSLYKVKGKKRHKILKGENQMNKVIWYIAAIVGCLTVIYGFYWLLKTGSYWLFYEDMVKDTINEMVKKVALK